MRLVINSLNFVNQALCKSYPSEFISYFHYCRSLRFEDKPDYSYLKRLFRDLFIREGGSLLVWVVRSFKISVQVCFISNFLCQYELLCDGVKELLKKNWKHRELDFSRLCISLSIFSPVMSCKIPLWSLLFFQAISLIMYLIGQYQNTHKSVLMQGHGYVIIKHHHKSLLFIIL